MKRTIEQNVADLETAKMRMDQARDRLCDAVIAGDEKSISRLEKVHAAAIEEYKYLRNEQSALAA